MYNVFLVDKMKWSPFVGDLEGFVTPQEIDLPSLTDEQMKDANDKKLIEAKNMAGTDESV